MTHSTGPTGALSRREFFALSGLIPAALVVQSAVGHRALAAAAPVVATGAGSVGKYPIGIELYGVRGELARDLPGTLREVAKIGYEAVEFYLMEQEGSRFSEFETAQRCLATWQKLRKTA